MVTIKVSMTNSPGSLDKATPPEAVDVLILGAGWTSKYLLPLLAEEGIKHAATTTTGREGTIAFRFDPSSDSEAPYHLLPDAKTVLITFPLKGKGQSKQLTALYANTHHTAARTRWIQLGSTGIFTEPGWSDLNSPYDKTNARAVAEDELLQDQGCVLNLAGLYGGERDPKNWLVRVAKSKDEVKKKGAVHLIHGQDVARAVVAVHRSFTAGKRWILADTRTYDWWELMMSWAPTVEKKEGAEGLKYAQWVGELMVEEEVRALPRDTEKLGRILDSRDFWAHHHLWPIMSLRSDY